MGVVSVILKRGLSTQTPSLYRRTAETIASTSAPFFEVWVVHVGWEVARSKYKLKNNTQNRKKKPVLCYYDQRVPSYHDPISRRVPPPPGAPLPLGVSAREPSRCCQCELSGPTARCAWSGPSIWSAPKKGQVLLLSCWGWWWWWRWLTPMN